MIVTEELFHRLEKERAFIVGAVTDLVRDLVCEGLYRDDSEARKMLEQLKDISVEIAKLNELMKTHRDKWGQGGMQAKNDRG
jgi:hypothetical protein